MTRIKDENEDRFGVELTCRKEDLVSHKGHIEGDVHPDDLRNINFDI